jgi:hypothetical protein
LFAPTTITVDVGASLQSLCTRSAHAQHARHLQLYNTDSFFRRNAGQADVLSKVMLPHAVIASLLFFFNCLLAEAGYVVQSSGQTSTGWQALLMMDSSNPGPYPNDAGIVHLDGSSSLKLALIFPFVGVSQRALVHVCVFVCVPVCECACCADHRFIRE